MLMKKLDAPHDMHIGAKFETNKHGRVTVVEYYNTYTVIVAFENTGTIRATTAAKLRSGHVLDRSVAPQSLMVGETVESVKYGTLTIVQVEPENIVVLEDSDGEEIRMIMASVQKLRSHNTPDPAEGNTPTSLDALTKRGKKTKDINRLFKKMLSDYGK